MFSVFTERYYTASNKLILLDYDGTLTGYTPHPEQAIPSAELLQLLQNLSVNPHTTLALVSGRSATSIDELFPDQPFKIIAEHGAMLKQNKQWSYFIKNNLHWKQPVRRILTNYALKSPGAFTEDKKFALAWHYRNCPALLGRNFSRQLIRELKAV